jgi:hypothetical protein
LNPDTDLIRIQGFDDQKLKKSAKIFFISFLDQNLQIYRTYPKVSIKTPKQLQERPLVFKREHSALQKNEIYELFQLLWVIVALLDPDTQNCSL